MRHARKTRVTQRVCLLDGHREGGRYSSQIRGLRIGRQAPVKRCLARWRSLRSAELRLNFGQTETEDCASFGAKL